MDDISLDRLLSGDLNKLPKLPKRVVRLFISSTFTDMTLERNSLMERVYPRLKKYCRERHGLDFQVVDMRWGVRDEATDDHQTVNLCSKEIENCQRVSLGPNFIALIGDKYGFRPLANRIKSTEYRSLRRCLIESDINTDFLDTWYKEDLNAVPAEYVLQPISSILKNFTNKNEPEVQMVDQRIWQAIQERLHDLLLIGSSRLVKQGRMSEREQALKYSISVTEREVIEGCLDLDETRSHCLVYIRSIVDLRDQLNQYFEDLSKLAEHQQQHQQQLEPIDPNDANAGASSSSASSDQRRDSAQRKASLKIGDDSITLTTSGPQTAAERKLERQRRLMAKYIDLTSKQANGGNGAAVWQVDEQAQEALNLLRETKLKSKLSPNGRNLTIYQVHWNQQDGISVKSDEHKRYLDELTGHFYQNLTRMIRVAVKSERSKVETRGLIGEVLQHSHYSLQVGRRLHGRSSELNRVRHYIVTGSSRPPGQQQYDEQQQSQGTAGLGRGGGRSEPVRPMFLYGVSGSGKTSVLARVATLAHDWIKQSAARRRSSSASEQTLFGLVTATSTSRAQDQVPVRDRWDRTPCIIMRFCCTTPASSSVVGMLTSVCRQLQYNFYQFGPLNGLIDDQTGAGFGQGSSGGTKSKLSGPSSSSSKLRTAATIADQLPYQQIPGDFVRLVYTFRRLLENCRHSVHRRRTFVIIIDSIERLSSPAECSVEAKFSWLTNLATLPPNVRLIVSCSSSGAIRNELDDYLHLKRHFLRAHMSCIGRIGTTNWLPGGTDAGLQNLDEPASRSSSSSSSSSSSNQAEITSSSPLNGRPGVSRFELIRRLVLPATRLARGSRALNSRYDNKLGTPGQQQQLQRPATLVRFNTTSSTKANATAMRSGSDAGSPSSLARVSSSDSVQSGHRSDGEGAGGVNRSPRATSSWGLLHIKPLGRKLGQAVLRRWLAESGRNLSYQQWAIVDRSLGHCSRPIFVKLAFGEVINWKSYSMRGDTRGLTFGSAWLADFRPDGGAAASHLSDLERLVVAGRRDELAKTAEFKWQMLAMEQQWLNYLDYRSSKLNTVNNERASKDGNGNLRGPNGSGDLVIRIGAAAGHSSPGILQAGEGGTAATGGAYASSTLGATASSASICHLSDTIEDAICQLFARIELKHGYLLTKHSLSYITAARNGICENELEDILSLDDVVLDDVFQYHLPPVRRIPPLLWTRIRNDLPDYLSERDADGIVLTWHHGQFKTVTERRYLANEQQLVYVHSLMADYFLGKWADKAKPFRCTKQQVQMAAEQLESAIQQSMRRDGVDQAQGKRQSSLTGGTSRGARLGSGSAAARSGASFALRNRLRSSDQHDKRLQWMQVKAHRRVPHQPLYYESALSSGAGSSSSSSLQSSESKSGQTPSEEHVGELDKSAGDHDEDGSMGRLSQSLAAPVERRYNIRKLTELPYHLLRSGRFLELASHTLFNYRWLFATIDALGLQSLFGDLNEAVQQLELELAKRQRATPDSNGDESAGILVTGTAEVEELDGFNALDELGAVSTGDNLTPVALKSLSDQLTALSSTLRLSASVVHANPRQLAPQLIGRLLPPPEVEIAESHYSTSDDQELRQGLPASSFLPAGSHANEYATNMAFIEQLLDQCDRDGCSDCALLPIGHCLQSADGLQLSSLEGHPFGVLSMCLASDQRHLLAVSSKFLMWNISTGEVARDVDPKLNGAIIRRLVLSSSNKFALAYTSDNQILSLEILTQQLSQFKLDDLLGCGSTLDASQGSSDLNQRDECAKHIEGIKLIDELNARRSFVWLRNGCVIVLRLDELDLDGGGQQQQHHNLQNEGQKTSAGSTSISLHYQLDYPELVATGAYGISSESRVLDVAIEQVEPSSDLVLILASSNSSSASSNDSDGGMQLISMKVSYGQMGTIDDIQVWLCLDAKLIALGPSLRQLVSVGHSSSSSSFEHVLLSRRRATSWSRGKVLSRIGATNSNSHASSVLALELESEPRLVDQDNEQASWATMGEESSGELYKQLAQFERDLDGDCDEIQPVHLAFGEADRADMSTFRTHSEHEFEFGSTKQKQAKFVKLYYSDHLMVLQLDKLAKEDDHQQLLESVEQASSSRYKRRCLMLPRDIRNVSLEPNKCQLSSRLVLKDETESPELAAGYYYVIVVATRRLLVYDLEGEQLLKCIEAHASRITGLLSIQILAPATSLSLFNDLNSQQRRRLRPLSTSALVTSSIDRTVKIWNLRNLNKKGHTIARLASTSGGRQFDSICLNSQRPIAACLSRGQLSLWDWQRSRLIGCYDSIEELGTTTPLKADGRKALHDQQPAGLSSSASNYPSSSSTFLPASSRISQCKFSKNGRYLALAGFNANQESCVSLVAIEGGPMQVDAKARQAINSTTTGSSSSSKVSFRLWASKILDRGHTVLKLKFLAQDSRLLVVTRANNPVARATKTAAPKQSSSSIASSLKSTQIEYDEQPVTHTTDDDGDDDDDSLERFDVICITSMTVPEVRHLYRIECQVPKYLSRDGNRTQDRLVLQDTNIGTGNQREGHSLVTSSRGGAGGLKVAVTCDHQFLVVVGVKKQAKEGLLPIVTSQARATADVSREVGISSGSDRFWTPILNVYLARDGQLTKTIDLSQLQMSNVQQQQQQPITKLTTSRSGLVPTLASGPAISSNGRPPPLSTNEASRYVAIPAVGQYSRLKPVNNRDRQSIVALMDNERGTSWLVDVGTKTLVAQSNSWTGRLSADGRFGLSRMFASGTTGSDGAGESSLSPGGLKLLEMRNCRPVKSLLSLDEFNSLMSSGRVPGERGTGGGGGSLGSATGSVTGQAEIICGFSRPNDAYAYFCDPRSRHLLLLRLRDSKLLANYRLPATPSRIKCTGDGLALVVGLDDGALLSLAIVDPLASETLARLAQYPSRRARKERNNKGNKQTN